MLDLRMTEALRLRKKHSQEHGGFIVDEEVQREEEEA